MEEANPKISAEQVIGKLKDEGDFDKLRLKIIRKLKENEALRNNIISAVKQSAALNRVGAENLKPRQLSDAIQEEIGNTVMAQISDGLWEVIRSNDGMQSEIKETVESVYNRLLNRKEKEGDGLSAPINPTPVDKEAVNDREVIISEREPSEPPDIVSEGNNNLEIHKEETEQLKEPKEEPHHSPDNDPSFPPGFAPHIINENPYDISDDDPDVPPGFG
ncbi:hypothetical protein GIB67_019036 [Kingdonia uniflora]|uniref:Uncharacterized protein n=1 Tax=Kingdonia uniflora TaxID=39325 RepID=A0A7J7MZK0_9MAGN|nr:hypothetical protein GIB67_019036 [Kingdonia uniflora]